MSKLTDAIAELEAEIGVLRQEVMDFRMERTIAVSNPPSGDYRFKTGGKAQLGKKLSARTTIQLERFISWFEMIEADKEPISQNARDDYDAVKAYLKC